MNSYLPVRGLGLTMLSVAVFYSLGFGVNVASAADPPQLFFDTTIPSMTFTGGTFSLPLGPGGLLIDTTISATKAQDHNSSRSNKTASISPGDPDNPDPIDPLRLHGTSYQMESVFNLIFDMALESPEMASQYGGGGGRIALVFNSVQAPLPSLAPRRFDASALDFGLLGSADSTGRALDHRGHVTVLKVALGGDGNGNGPPDEIAFAPGGIQLLTVPGSDDYSMLPDGRVSHTFDTDLFMTASFGDSMNSIEATWGPLRIRMTEVGQLSNPIVPEPATSTLLMLGGLFCFARRRR